MKAVRFAGRGRVEIVEKPKPVARGELVVVKVTASGICGTDLEVLLPSEQPLERTPGHEVAGIVAEVDRATRFRVGDRVIVNCHVTCGRCEHCRNGDLIFCPELQVIGFELDGGDAEYVLVPEASLRHLPDDLSDELGVLVGDALGTPYHAVKKAGINPGELVGIFGAGPLGLMAVPVAKSFGARVVAVDLNDQRLQTAREFGADHTVNPKTTDLVAEVRQWSGGRGLDRAIDCSGNKYSIVSALNALKLRGRLVQVGVCPDLELHTSTHLIEKELEISGSRNFNDRELDEIIAFVRTNPQINRVISHRFALDDAAAAFALAQRREGLKVVLRP